MPKPMTAKPRPLPADLRHFRSEDYLQQDDLIEDEQDLPPPNWHWLILLGFSAGVLVVAALDLWSR